MREFLFRGKCLDNGDWSFGDLVHDDRCGIYIFPIYAENFYTEYAVDPSTVGQYTGLEDRNNIKIFEGDLIEIRDINDEKVGQGIVEFAKENGLWYVNGEDSAN